MYARVTEFTGTPEQLASSANETDTMARRIEEIPGTLGMYFLVDAEGGKAMSITLWDSEDSMRASEMAANTLRTDSSTEQGTTIVGVGRYEVVANTARVLAVPGD